MCYKYKTMPNLMIGSYLNMLNTRHVKMIWATFRRTSDNKLTDIL